MRAKKAPRELRDVTVEYARGVFLLQPESERGRLWLVGCGARMGWPWQHGALAIDNQATGQQTIMAMANAGLEVGNFPRDSRLKGRIAFDGEVIH